MTEKLQKEANQARLSSLFHLHTTKIRETNLPTVATNACKRQTSPPFDRQLNATFATCEEARASFGPSHPGEHLGLASHVPPLSRGGCSSDHQGGRGQGHITFCSALRCCTRLRGTSITASTVSPGEWGNSTICSALRCCTRSRGGLTSPPRRFLPEPEECPHLARQFAVELVHAGMTSPPRRSHQEIEEIPQLVWQCAVELVHAGLTSPPRRRRNLVSSITSCLPLPFDSFHAGMFFSLSQYLSTAVFASGFSLPVE